MNERARLTQLAETLQAAGIPDASRDARRLWDHAFAEGQRAGPQDRDAPNPETLQALDKAMAQRLSRRPVAQIIGRRAFWAHEFRVTADVLDPRPDTETLVEQALAVPFGRVLDLGTGSGCILLSLLAARPGATGLGTDISPAALAVAQDNAASLGLTADFAQSDWFAAVTGRFDLIVSNPPYIAAAEMAVLAPEVRLHEPRIALTDEGDGLSAYRIIAAGASDHLTPGGWLMVEIGPTQGADVSALFTRAGLESCTIHPDLDGRDRVVAARAPLHRGTDATLSP